jgi:membrane associated rhomboid family serine protease
MTTSGTDTSDEGRLQQSLFIVVAFVAVLWLIQLGAAYFDIDLGRDGIYPRRIGGLVGIAFAPLIHGSLWHLFANSVSIIILGTVLLYGYPRSAGITIGSLYVGTGLCVWLFGRSAYHIGASGLTFGMMFFVFTIGAIRWDRRAIALSLIVFVLYGGLVWGIFPDDPNVSYESHFFGAMLGVVLAILCRNRDPAPPEKRYSWEDEAETQFDELDYQPGQDGDGLDNGSGEVRAEPPTPTQGARPTQGSGES